MMVENEHVVLLDLDTGPAPHILDTMEAARSDRGVHLYSGGAGGGKSLARQLLLAAATAETVRRPIEPTRVIMDEVIYETPATQGLRGKSLRRAEKKQRRMKRQLGFDVEQ